MKNKDLTNRIVRTLAVFGFGIVFYIGVALMFLGSGWGHSLIVSDNASNVSTSKLTAKEAEKNAKKKTDYDASKTKSVSASELWKAKQYPAYSIGRMSVPAVNIHNPLFNGYGSAGQNLSYGVCTVLPDRQMGGINNYVLAGHYMGSYGSAVLDNLHYIKNGDLICVTDMKKIYLYKATYKSYAIKPTQVEVENNVQGKKTITLITCSDFNVSKYGYGQNRTVVQGVLAKTVKATKSNLLACELTDKAQKNNKVVALSNKGITSASKRVNEKWYQKITLKQVVAAFSSVWLVVISIMIFKIWRKERQ